MSRYTKTERILRLWKKGLNRNEIAAKIGCSPQYATTVKWRAERPGYHARWMRERREDAQYYVKERQQQRRYAKANAEKRTEYQRAYRRRRQQEASQ